MACELDRAKKGRAEPVLNRLGLSLTSTDRLAATGDKPTTECVRYTASLQAGVVPCCWSQTPLVRREAAVLPVSCSRAISLLLTQ
jgi:hypothetical protein